MRTVPEVNQGAIVHTPLPTSPQPGHFGRVPAPGAASAYSYGSRRIGG
ncbi:hypothetical protein [Streptomyces sp. Ru62]|nr:hypothetical protein [Streptomyces sp. Ru62]